MDQIHIRAHTDQQFSDAVSPDFTPPSSHRDSGSGSASSRISASTSLNSLSKKPSHSDIAEDAGHYDRNAARKGQSYVSEGAISPLHDGAFQLDLNLDNMEGIVDPNLANAPAAPPEQYRGPAASSQRTTTDSSTTGSLLLQDALGNLNSCFATSISSGGSGGSASAMGPVAQTPSRSVLSEAHRQSDNPFTRNPFGPNSSAGSVDNKPRTPPSPHTLSPQHTLPLSTQPRRPSQLRNVKMGSVDSDTSGDIPYSAALQPMTPAWATSAGAGQTVFNDPFGSTTTARPPVAEGVSPSRPGTRSATGALYAPNEGTALGRSLDGQASPNRGSAAAAAAAGAGAAVWAAPESWGVEGDDLPEDATSSDDEDGWVVEEVASSPAEDANNNPLDGRSLSSGGKRPPPFGFKSAQPGVPTSRGADRPGSSRAPRVKTSSGRPSTASGPVSGRPGTSGSLHAPLTPVSRCAASLGLWLT